VVVVVIVRRVMIFGIVLPVPAHGFSLMSRFVGGSKPSARRPSGRLLRMAGASVLPTGARGAFSRYEPEKSPKFWVSAAT